LELLATVCAGPSGCAGVEKAINDRAKEIIDSQKIPDASLAPEQIARLEKLSDDSQVVWVESG
jgi:hypothetical protein